MKNWNTVDPDVVKLLPGGPNAHWTPGRGGKRIRYIVRHHNAGVLTIDQCYNTWLTRPASAHYQVEVGGRIGQLVWDSNTAWHAANLLRNQESIGIEHANSGGAAAGWPIADKTIEEGAHLAAALCKFYNLGRPEFGKNIRDHKETGQTSCPYHLAAGGKYHARWMQRAQYWFDQMTKPQSKEDTMTPAQEQLVRDLIGRVSQLQSDVTDIRLQQGSGRDYSGFEQSGHRTLLDLAAATAEKVGVPDTFDTKAKR